MCVCVCIYIYIYILLEKIIKNTETNSNGMILTGNSRQHMQVMH